MFAARPEADRIRRVNVSKKRPHTWGVGGVQRRNRGPVDGGCGERRASLLRELDPFFLQVLAQTVSIPPRGRRLPTGSRMGIVRIP